MTKPIRKILRSGKLVNLLNLRPEDICLEDVTAGLMQPRYTNHCPFYYSVAYHSVIIYDLLNDPKALLHDASEAFMGDMHRELKHSFVGDQYRILEDTVQNVIYERFGLTPGKDEAIHVADKQLLIHEMKQFWPNANWEHDGLICEDGSLWEHPVPPAREGTFDQILKLSYSEQERVFKSRCREAGIK
jgi:hypothetical protein